MRQLALTVVAAFFTIALLATSSKTASASGVLSPTRVAPAGVVTDKASSVHYRHRRRGYYGGPFFSFGFGYGRPYYYRPYYGGYYGGYYRPYYKKRRYYRKRRYGKRRYYRRYRDHRSPHLLPRRYGFPGQERAGTGR